MFYMKDCIEFELTKNLLSLFASSYKANTESSQLYLEKAVMT